MRRAYSDTQGMRTSTLQARYGSRQHTGLRACGRQHKGLYYGLRVSPSLLPREVCAARLAQEASIFSS